VALFESVVLLDVMQVIASDDDSSLHLGRNDDASKGVKLNSIRLGRREGSA
jgi:hypothetical protein